MSKSERCSTSVSGKLQEGITYEFAPISQHLSHFLLPASLGSENQN
jgi:hypothetical protein